MELIIEKVKSNLNILLKDKKSILIALSGGKDSMTLLNILLKLKNEYNLILQVAYVNHNLRDKESIKEEKFVKKNCKKLKVPVYSLRIKKEIWNNIKKESIEMAARKIRYDFFNKIANENDINYIATAHNFNDKIETYFLQMFRAGGIDTFKSIPLKNKNIIRPLLNVTRKEIEDYVKINSIPFFEDYTNHQNYYKRNIIRNRLLPIFREIHPDFEKSFIHIFKFMNEEYFFIKYMTKKIYETNLVFESNNKVCIIKKNYSELPAIMQKYILKLILKKLGYPVKINMPMLKILSGNKMKYLYSKKSFYCKDMGDLIFFINQDKLDIFNDQITVNDIPFEYKNNGFIINIQKKSVIDPKKHFSIKYDRTMFPLVIRKLEPDDKFDISDTIKKEIKKILIEMKIPEPLHKEGIVIETKDKIIAGFTLNNYHRVSKAFYIDVSSKENFVINISSY